MRYSSSGHVPLSRRKFVETAIAAGASLAVNQMAAAADPPSEKLLGPIIGHTDAVSSMVWLRPPIAGAFFLELTPLAGGPARVFPGEATVANDLCIHWKVDGLQPASSYRYQIKSAGNTVADSLNQIIKTAPVVEKAAKVRG